MAIWTVEATKSGDEVVLMHWDGKKLVECGRGSMALFQDILEFAVTNADPGDRVQTPDGLFVRMPIPAGMN